MDASHKGDKIEGSSSNSATPLFPRLHVNDTKKIGARAPPRNKMALYDQQLSMSSQKFNTPSSTLQDNGALSSQCIFGTKRSMFSPYKNTAASIRSNGKLPLHSIGGIRVIEDGISGNFTKTSMLSNSNDNVNVAASSLPIQLQCSAVAPSSLDAQFRPIVHKDQAATSVPPRIELDSLKDVIPVGENCTLELQTNTTHEVKPYATMSMGLEPEQHVRILSEYGLEVPKTSVRNDNKLSPVSETRESELDEADITKARLHLDDMPKQEKEVNRGDASYDEEQKMSIVNNNAYVMRSESCHESVITDVGHQTLKVGNGNQFEVKDGKDSVSRSIITSEAVIKMIGLEDFQKARNAIIHQQKVFSMQVFELHRLIRVQKLIAGSGNIQHDKLFEPTSLKNLLSKSIPEAPPWQGKSKNGVATTKVTADNKRSQPLHHFISPEIAKAEEDFRHQTNLPDFPISWPWLAPPAGGGNQWLFPVMSPSEGLIYKPYPTQPLAPPPLPPPPLPGGFLSPLYNDVGPPNPTSCREDFMNLTCGVSGTTLPVGSTYFPPYGMHLPNNIYPSSTTAAAFKPMTNSNINFGATLHQSSCNVGEANNIDGEKMEIRTSFPRKILSSSDILQLFPTSPTLSHDLEQPTIQGHNNEQKTQVIKVTPHSPKLATESAARIFKLIQEERNHYCN